MSAVDQGLDAAVQRVMDETCAVRDLTDTLHKCLLHVSVWGAGELGCATAEKAARAAREEVSALTQQARADEPHCPSCTCGRRAPLQGESAGSRHGAKARGTISWDEHLEYHAAYAIQHSGQSAEAIAERGGFSWGEFLMFVGREPRTWRAR